MVPVTVQHVTPVLVQALPVAVIQCVQPLPQHPEIRIVLQLADRHQLRRLRAEPQPLLAAVKIGELRGRMVGITHRRAQRGVAQCAVALAVHRAFVMVERRLHVEMVVPDVEEVHLRELADMVAVRVHAACDRVAPVLLLDAVRPPADLHGHREPLHVPFPRSRRCLVEVVDVEHEPVAGGAEHAEIADMRVADRLDGDAGGRRVREVVRHDERGAAVERERGIAHAVVPQRDQIRHPLRRLFLQKPDHVAPARHDLPVGVALQRCGLAQRDAGLGLPQRRVGHVP